MKSSGRSVISRALHRPGLVGEVHVYRRDSRSGVKHIIDGHGEAVARRVPAIIAYGRFRPPTKRGRIVTIEYQGMAVILKRTSEDRETVWLLTSFVITEDYRFGKKKGAMNARSFNRNLAPTQPEPMVLSSQDGCARKNGATLRARCNAIVSLQRVLDADLAAASYRNRANRLLDLLQNGRRIGPPADRSAAAKKGWETRRARGWTPKRMHSARADKLLKAGFVQTYSHGDQVKFGLRLKTIWMQRRTPPRSKSIWPGPEKPCVPASCAAPITARVGRRRI